MKLVIEERESAALRAALAPRDRWVSSALARVEVVRAVSPGGDRPVAHARRLLDRIALIAVDDRILAAAAEAAPPTLRSLDAIHLASAQALGPELGALITYDRRMAEAAAVVGLAVEAPA